MQGVAPPAPAASRKGVIPRLSRLLALAHHIQELLDTGQAKDLADVAAVQKRVKSSGRA